MKRNGNEKDREDGEEEKKRGRGTRRTERTSRERNSEKTRKRSRRKTSRKEQPKKRKSKKEDTSPQCNILARLSWRSACLAEEDDPRLVLLLLVGAQYLPVLPLGNLDEVVQSSDHVVQLELEVVTLLLYGLDAFDVGVRLASVLDTFLREAAPHLEATHHEVHYF
jgi:hypothetical protein